MQAIGAIKMDNDVLGWVIAAQKESHADSRNYRTDRMATFKPSMINYSTGWTSCSELPTTF